MVVCQMQLTGCSFAHWAAILYPIESSLTVKTDSIMYINYFCYALLYLSKEKSHNSMHTSRLERCQRCSSLMNNKAIKRKQLDKGTSELCIATNCLTCTQLTIFWHQYAKCRTQQMVSSYIRCTICCTFTLFRDKSFKHLLWQLHNFDQSETSRQWTLGLTECTYTSKVSHSEVWVLNSKKCIKIKRATITISKKNTLLKLGWFNNNLDGFTLTIWHIGVHSLGRHGGG